MSSDSGRMNRQCVLFHSSEDANKPGFTIRETPVPKVTGDDVLLKVLVSAHITNAEYRWCIQNMFRFISLISCQIAEQYLMISVAASFGGSYEVPIVSMMSLIVP